MNLVKTLLSSLFIAISVFAAGAQKVFLTGDSHVSAKVYAEKVGEILKKNIPGVEYSFWGKGSAGFYTFNDTKEYMDKIFDAQPEVLVVHLGTNGSYSKFDKEKFINDMTLFYQNVREKLPDTKIVFVTPFDNKKKENQTGKWYVNPNTRNCAETIITVSENLPGTFVIDNNKDAGSIFADSSDLIRQDHIHLTINGYKLLGEQVAGALLAIPELWSLEN